MSDSVRETACTHCIHREVCIHKQDFLDINKAVLEASVVKSCELSDGQRYVSKRVADFECLGEIRVYCRYFRDY